MSPLTRSNLLKAASGLAKIGNQLSDSEQAYLQLLIVNIHMLADISFADVTVLIKDEKDFYVLDHARPSNSSTVYQEDVVGKLLNKGSYRLVLSSFQSGEISERGIYSIQKNHWIHTIATPINIKSENDSPSRTVGVMLCEKRSRSSTEAGQIETLYFSAFMRLAQMVADGTYPNPRDIFEHDHPPRVGDGIIVLDTEANSQGLSPNALSALKRIGIIQDSTNKQVHNLNLAVIKSTLKTGLPHSEEIESNSHTVILRCLPLIEKGKVMGTLVLLRDITELRRRDLLLITKDVTIAEIHHRVKNNLQTISSLLQLQSRRLSNPEAKSAVLESARRIRSFAIVHEILSREISNEIRYERIVKSLVDEATEALFSSETSIDLEIQGSAGYISSEIASTLALITNELLQNAIKHAFVDSSEREPKIVIRFKRLKDNLQISVSDNGIGIPKNYELAEDPGTNEINSGTGLGLTIVRTLVESDLRGEIQIMGTRKGTSIKLALALPQLDSVIA